MEATMKESQELESRIEALPTGKDRDFVFRVLAAVIHDADNEEFFTEIEAAIFNHAPANEVEAILDKYGH